MKRLKIFSSAFFVGLMLLVATQIADASEGTVELTGSSDARCFASSVFMQNLQYKLLVTCENLRYPPAPDKFAYVLWKVESEGGATKKVGALGFGKAEYTFQGSFRELFVTSERNDKARTPSSEVVMRGTVQPIQILGNGTPQPQPAEPTPTPETQAEDQSQAENFGEILAEAEPIISTPQTGSRIIAFLRQGGILLAVGVFAILLILAFLTRARG